MKITVAKTYNTLIEEAEIEIIVNKNGKNYDATGCFFEWNEFGDIEIVNVYEELELADDIEDDELVYTLIQLKKQYGIMVYESTCSHIYHWGYIEGLLKDIRIYEYRYVGKNSEEHNQMFACCR